MTCKASLMQGNLFCLYDDFYRAHRLVFFLHNKATVCLCAVIRSDFFFFFFNGERDNNLDRNAGCKTREHFKYAVAVSASHLHIPPLLAPLSSHKISFEETRPLIDSSLEVARAAKHKLEPVAFCQLGQEACWSAVAWEEQRLQETPEENNMKF